MDGTDASCNRSITSCYQKTLAIYNLLRLEEKAKRIELPIAMFKECLVRSDGDGANAVVNASTMLKDVRCNYEYNSKTCGSTSEAT